MKAGLAVGTVAGVSVIAIGGKTGLQALQVTQPAQPVANTDPFAAQQITINVNGTEQSLLVEPRDTLANILRDKLGLIGTKMGCNRMSCGSCTVLVDGAPTESCQYLALWAAGKSVTTVEAGLLAPTLNPKATPDPVIGALQNAWVQQDGGQCAFCSPGNIMSATALLKQNPNPTVDDIKTALSGNLCRCGNYPNIIASVQLAAKNLGGV
ncbi:MAG: (2Fe-2S)-binding protein [Nitrososphaerota archaeon]|nr:(2Fe-2S)-binding protein [Nitrososphaerota archaeon]